MASRILLNPGEEILLNRGKNTEKWTITGFVGEGGACVCYNARNGAKSGRLKEFYPLDNWGRPCFERTEEGNLTAPREQMENLCAQFREAYEILELTKLDREKARILNNFIPPYELLTGQKGSIYVWTPDDKQGVSFEDYLSEVRADPKNKAEHKLYNIINTVLTLTDCIRVLHDVGLLHLDIKPSNFMVLYDGDYNINPAGISLFDVNTLYPIGTKQRALAGTAHYCAPEVYRGKAENRSDIYSVGMMLLRAIVFSENGEILPFRREDRAQLDVLVAGSPLMAASEANSNVYLRHCLTQILKKCLATRVDDRYDCCEDLMEDLRRAKTYLLPEVAGEFLGLEKRLAILDAEPADLCSPAAVMQDLLFRHPLYENLEPDQRDINVLVVGAGTYGQKFMDICLQAGQILNHRLHIRAVSRDPELDKEVYLQVRPALPEFVNVNGSRKGKESYADLDFTRSPVRFDCDGTGAKELLDTYPAPHFIFVSLGDDELNREMARALKKETKMHGWNCGIHYVQTRDSREEGAVWIHTPLTAKTIDPRLEKWAFNAHLCWMTDSEDLVLARKQFRQKYNLEASLAYALSIRSKLFSVGVSEENPYALEDDAICDQLAALEHRRWVLEKVTSGWQAPRNKDGSMDYLTGISRGELKDKKKRLHHCIVPSTPGNPLKHFTPEQWEKPGIWDENLDELDRVSLETYRNCREIADQRRKEGLPGDLILMQRSISWLGPEENGAFATYRHYLQRILLGDERVTKGFETVENRLKTALSGAEPQLRRELVSRMQQIRRAIFPVMECNLRRNYKDSDEALVRRIPFVLTHTPEKKSGAQPKIPLSELLPTYDPRPINTEDIALPPELLQLTERIAENVHDVWAVGRIKEGWIYGENRDNDLKTTPCLVPYGDLPESEKEYDRRTAMETLKLIIKLGYKIEP